MKSVKTGLGLLVFGISLLLILSGLILGVFGDLQHRSYIFAFLIAAVLTVSVAACHIRAGKLIADIDTWNVRRIEIVLTVLCFIISLTWVLLFRVEPREDYLTFWTTAKDLASSSRLRQREYLALFPHILGYSAFLSLVLRIFGTGLLVPAVVNCILSSLTGHFIFRVIQSQFGTTAGVFAFLLWILCPSRILYNTMVLSEPYYTCLLFCFFSVLHSFAEKKQKSIVASLLMGLLAGAILALVNTARPIGIIPILALVIWLVFLTTWGGKKEKIKTWVVFVLALIICYQVCGSGWKQFERKVLEEEPAGIPGYSISVGFNMESQGTYCQDDMDHLFAFRYDEGGSAVSAQQAMFGIAKERIAQGKRQIPMLMIHKLKSLIGNDEGGAYYSRIELGQTGYLFASLFSNVFYYSICLLAVLGLLRLMRKRSCGIFFVPILYYIGLVLAQLLVEVSGRYHYSLVPVLICLAAAAANKHFYCNTAMRLMMVRMAS